MNAIKRWYYRLVFWNIPVETEEQRASTRRASRSPEELTRDKLTAILSKPDDELTVEDFDFMFLHSEPVQLWEPPEIIVSSAFDTVALTCLDCNKTLTVMNEASVHSVHDAVRAHQLVHWTADRKAEESDAS